MTIYTTQTGTRIVIDGVTYSVLKRRRIMPGSYVVTLCQYLAPMDS